MSECVSEMFWCFFKQDYLLFAPAGHLMEMFLLSTQKISAFWSCIAIVLAEVCLFAQKRRIIEAFLLSIQTICFCGK